jgi:hypothetical protein
LLGDVIVSDGLIQYDFGRRLSDKFIRKDTLNDNLGRLSTEIRAFLERVKGHRGRMRLRSNTSEYLTAIGQKPGFEKARYPGADADKLFEPTYRHKHRDSRPCDTCTKCEKKEDEVCETALNSLCSELECDEHRLVPRRRLVKTIEVRDVLEVTAHAI